MCVHCVWGIVMWCFGRIAQSWSLSCSACFCFKIIFYLVSLQETPSARWLVWCSTGASWRAGRRSRSLIPTAPYGENTVTHTHAHELFIFLLLMSLCSWRWRFIRAHDHTLCLLFTNISSIWFFFHQSAEVLRVDLHAAGVHLGDGESGEAGRYHPGVGDQNWPRKTES